MRYVAILCGVFLLLTLALFPNTVFSETYKWKDDRGVTHYSDSLSGVPAKYRDQVTVPDLDKPITTSDMAKKAIGDAKDKIKNVADDIDTKDPSPTVIAGGVLGLLVVGGLLYLIFKKLRKRPLP